MNILDKLTQNFDLNLFFSSFSYNLHMYVFVQKHPIQNVSKWVKLKNVDIVQLPPITYNNAEWVHACLLLLTTYDLRFLVILGTVNGLIGLDFVALYWLQSSIIQGLLIFTHTNY